LSVSTKGQGVVQYSWVGFYSCVWYS